MKILNSNFLSRFKKNPGPPDCFRSNIAEAAIAQGTIYDNVCSDLLFGLASETAILSVFVLRYWESDRRELLKRINIARSSNSHYIAWEDIRENMAVIASSENSYWLFYFNWQERDSCLVGRCPKGDESQEQVVSKFKLWAQACVSEAGGHHEWAGEEPIPLGREVFESSGDESSAICFTPKSTDVRRLWF